MEWEVARMRSRFLHYVNEPSNEYLNVEKNDNCPTKSINFNKQKSSVINGS